MKCPQNEVWGHFGQVENNRFLRPHCRKDSNFALEVQNNCFEAKNGFWEVKSKIFLQYVLKKH